jgi:hypothetical protein
MLSLPFAIFRSNASNARPIGISLWTHLLTCAIIRDVIAGKFEGNNG